MRTQHRKHEFFEKGSQRRAQRDIPGRDLTHNDRGPAPIDHRIRRTEFFHYPSGGRR